MSKNDKESKEPNETEINSASTENEITSPDSSDPNSDEMNREGSSEDQPSAGLEDESSSEDLLEDVRRSLIEQDETDKNSKNSTWWRRLSRKGKPAETEPSPANVEIDLPSSLLQPDVVEEQKQIAQPEEYQDQLDDLINELESKPSNSEVETASVTDKVEIAHEPEPEIDFGQRKEQAFRPRPQDEGASDSDVRSIALEGGEEVFVEVESRPQDTFKDRVSAFENALKPYRTYIYITLGFVGIVLAGLLSFLLYNAYQQSRPVPVQEPSNLPYPVGVSLPGGWSFQLSRGTVQGGSWEPSGPEWLEGTEVCRWVSLPWSRQLEAVLRTLNPNDPIELVMSNNDKFTYSVYSVYEMTLEEIQALDSNSPCLLLILTGAESEKRWVLTAVP